MALFFSLQSLGNILLYGGSWRLVVLVRIVAGVAAVKSWLGSRPEPERLAPSSPKADSIADCYAGVEESSSPQPWAKKKKSLDEELGFSAPVSESPDVSSGITAPLRSPPREQEKKKVKKTVSFNEELNQVHEVEYWFDPRIHKHRKIRFWWAGGSSLRSVAGLRFEPHGHNQLHFPRTKWVEDVPDWSAEDQDSDVEMVDD